MTTAGSQPIPASRRISLSFRISLRTAFSPARVCRQAKQSDHSRPGEVLRRLLQIHDERLARSSVSRERGRHGDEAPQRPLGALQRERAVITGRVQAETDVFGCPVRKGQRECVLFVDRRSDGTYLGIASKETEKMACSPLPM